MSDNIKVYLTGVTGRMGNAVREAVLEAQDMTLVGAYSPKHAGETIEGTDLVIDGDLEAGLAKSDADVMVEFSRPAFAQENVACALRAGVDCVVGTTGSSTEMWQENWEKNSQNGAAVFVAPNFTTGAVLMMVMSQMAAKFFPDAEVIEFHHDNKLDAPSGTAMRTAELIAGARTAPVDAPGAETELPGAEGARGANIQGVPVHAVRTNGYVAHQEVIFGSKGQTLTIRHDSIDRMSYMPGVLLAVREASKLDGVVIGLEKLMNL